MRRFFPALLLILAVPALAQRQPAQMTTLPTANPQEFDLLDKTGTWVPLDAVANGVDVRSFGAKCDGATDDSAALNAAAAAAGSAGKALRIPNGVCYSASALNFGSIVLVGAVPVVASNPASGPTISCAATIAAACVTTGTLSGSGFLGATIRDMIFSFTGTPVAGDAALNVRGFGSVLENTFVYNAWDGYLFSNGLSAHLGHPHSGRIYSNHVVQNGFPEVYIVNARFGMNGVSGAGDVAGSNSFFRITGSDPNSLVCSGCQLNLGNQSPKYVYDFYNLTSQTNGVYQLTDTIIDMSIGAGTAIIHSDGTGTCLRCIWSGVQINAPSLPFFSLGSAASMNQAAFTDSNFFVASFTLPPIAYLNLRLSNLLVTGTVTIDALNGQANVSGVYASGAMIVRGSWSFLMLDDLIGASYNDTAATGNVFAANVPSIGWTPQLQFGGTNVGMTQTTSYGKASRQSDGTVKQVFGVGLSALGTSTGVAAIIGTPYTCDGFGLGQIDMGPVYATGMAALTTTPMAAAKGANNGIALLNAAPAGMAGLVQGNFTNTSTIAGTAICHPL